MHDDKLAADEARRQIQHEAIKTEVESDVNAGIAARADRTTPREAAQMEQVAGEFRGKAINEVVESEREVERSRTMARVSQVVDYMFYVLYSLLVLRLILALLRANPRSGFVEFIYSVTNPFFAPFRGIISNRGTDEVIAQAVPIIIALIVYALLHAGINGLLRLLAHRKTEI
ncbi:MAG: YggT family protein [Pyrinomonadaceae bacterium]|nr:YggT family protein [Pyrinomonadaceae bacterium]